MSALPARPADGWPRPPDSRRPGPPTGPVGGARRAGLTLAVVVLLAALVAAGRLVQVVGGTLPLPGRAGPAAEGPEAATARRFYAALDAALAGQGDALLSSLVAPDVIVHAPDGAAQPGGLADRLAALRQIAPDLRYSVDEVVADDDRVAVRVAVTGGPGTSWSTAAQPGGGWTGAEVLRVADGRVAEYWPAPVELAMTRRTADLTIPRQSGRLEVSVVRFTLRPGAAMHDLVGPLDHLVVPEQGSVTVDLAREAMLWRGGAPGLGWEKTTRDGQAVVLVPGDALLVPRDVRNTIRNPGDAPATLLGTAIFPITALNLDRMYSPGQAPPIVAVYGLTRPGITQPTAAWTGVAETRLAVAFDGCVAAIGQRLSLAWEPLLPGTTIPAHAAEGQEMVITLGGAIGYAGDPPERGNGTVGAPGLAFATSRGLTPALAPRGPLAARALVVTIDPVMFTGPVSNPAKQLRPARGAGCGDAS